MAARIVLVALCLGWMATAQQAQTTATPQKPARAHKAKRSSAATTQAASTSTPAEPVAPPPQVTYENGLLTIKAQNSTLHDILDLVHTRTGAIITAPVDLSQKIVTQLGPAAPGKVISDLLDQAGFDYMILGTAANPNAMGEIRVQSRAKETVESGTRTPTEPPASSVPNDADTTAAQPARDQSSPDNADPPPPKDDNQSPQPQPEQPQPPPKPPNP